ncbi:MAG: hypothetical protein Q9218_000025 [Villophora microphyllina]
MSRMPNMWQHVPFDQQLHPTEQHMYTGVDYRAPPTVFKDASTQTNDNSSFQAGAQQNYDPQMNLHQAFSAAQTAINTQATPAAGCEWNLLQPSDFQFVEPITFSPGHLSTVKSHKRKADTAGLLQPVLDPKKQRVANASVQTQSQPIKHGRPRKVVPTKKRTSLPKLSQKHPVQAGIHVDIWHCIILNSPLSFVFKIKDVSKEIRDLLTDNPAVWRDVRRRTYGHDHPDPPTGITERQYADLLVGFGCQDKHCDGKSKARKVYWAFQRRWCTLCWKKNTIMVIPCASASSHPPLADLLQEDACEVFLAKYPELTKYMTTARVDGWNRYAGVAEPDDINPLPSRGSAYKRAYLRTDLARITQTVETAERRKSVGGSNPPKALMSLIASMKEANGKDIPKLRAIETWADSWKKDALSRSGERKQTKSAFFTVQAQLMDPLLDRKTLEQMDCFRKAVSAPGGPTRRAWKSVEKKLQAQRAKTEAALSITEQKKIPSWHEYLVLVQRRENNNTEEQIAVLALADQVLGSLVEGPGSIQVADGDFVRTALNRIHNSYQENKHEGDHPLLMDDAKMIVKLKIEPIIESWKDDKRKRTALGLRCPGCKNGTKRLHSFERLIYHIYGGHARRVGDFDYFRGPDDPRLDDSPHGSGFPWSYIEWPSNLPILAAGESAKGRWDLHATTEEHYNSPAYDSAQSDPGAGAFDNRVASDCGIAGPDLVKDIRFVIRAFQSTDISDQYKTQIALEFARQRYESIDTSPPTFGPLKALRLLLLHKGLKGVFENFRCKKCCEEAQTDGRKGQFFRSRKALGTLSDHFQSEHPRDDWTRDMFELPTPQELLKELQQPSNVVAYTVFDRLFPARPDATLDPNLQHSPTDNTIQDMDLEWSDVSEDLDYVDDSEEFDECESPQQHDKSQEDEQSDAIRVSKDSERPEESEASQEL